MTELNIACISDIHLGNKRNNARNIIKNLYAAFPDNSKTGELDIIFIAGDVFDSLFSLSDNDVVDIDLWIASLLQLCVKHDILLRVLDGTKSHDWFQSERFMTIANILNNKVDVKYYKEIAVEYIERFGINVLYVPDEANDTTEKTLKQVKEILEAKGLKRVDYAVMHGQFEHQLPPFIKVQKHDSKEYLALVKELIFVGHIHTHSVYKRIIAQGSFDRISHGEEEPKGHVRVVMKSNGDRNIKFIENKKATIFKTINCTGLTLDDTIIKIDIEAGDLPDNSHVRVCGNADNPIFTNMNMLVARYPLLVWSKLINETHEEIEIDDITTDVNYIPITITKNNIKDLLLNRIQLIPRSENVLKCINGILNEIV